MPRQARLDPLGALYHVMIQGIEGSDIFFDDENRGDFTSRISSLVAITGARIVAWAFMTNHVHLVLFSGHSNYDGDSTKYRSRDVSGCNGSETKGG
jgi:REP element-mobilizing transposase RayT